MNANRLRPQEIVTGIGGLALFASLFLEWTGGLSGWNTLAIIDLLLALTAIGAIVLPIVAAMNSKPDAPITGDALVTLAGMVSTVLVGFRIIDPVGESGRGAGLWVALAAALVISVSAWSAMADEGTGGPTLRTPTEPG